MASLQWPRCNVFVAMALLKWLCFNDLVPIVSYFRLSMFANQATIFLDLYAKENTAITPRRLCEAML